jgi:hypothetical protein
MISNLLLEIINDLGLEFPIPDVLTLKDDSQLRLKAVAIYNQNGICSYCQKELGNIGELHHALISRKDVQGHPKADMIHHTTNVLVLHPYCHLKITRQESYKSLCQIHGKNAVDKWQLLTAELFVSTFRRISDENDYDI